MTAVHVLGGVSLVVVVAVSSVVRAGLDARVGERATAVDAGGEEAVVSQIQMSAWEKGVVPAAFGPLRDRMRP